ncbi:MAG: glycine cleavage T C-terminal barrel domain-containing protein [Tepidisphaeraceae bacterium]
MFDQQQNVIGVVTSSTMSPILSDAAIALAIVRRPHFEPEQRLLIAAEGAVRGATVVPLPFLGKGDA